MIHIGTKVQRTPVGYVADFCPLCHDVRAFEVTCLRPVRHVNSLTIAQEGPEEWEVVCRTCGILTETDVAPYRAFLRGRNRPLAELLEQTNPCLAEVRAERLKLEERLRRGDLSSEERHRLLGEPFMYADLALRDRLGQGVRSRAARPALLFLWLIVMPLGVGLMIVLRGSNAPLKGLFAALAGAAWLVFVWKVRPSHYVRRCLQPVILRGLRPLRPTVPELGRLRQIIAVESPELARHLDFDALARDLDAPGLSA